MSGVPARIVPRSFWVNKQNDDEHVQVTELVTWRTCPNSVAFVVLGEPGDREMLVEDFLDKFDPVGGHDEGVGLSLLNETDVPREPS